VAIGKGPLFGNGDDVAPRSTLKIGQVMGEPKLDGSEYWHKVHFLPRLGEKPEFVAPSFSSRSAYNHLPT
jgi:hypothetical protein